MKIAERRFSIPDCITEDGLPDKAFRLLIFLFKTSDCSGKTNPGYDAMKEGADITSRSTVSDALKTLRKHGWFEYVKKGAGRNSIFYLRLPPRFSKEPKKANVIPLKLASVRVQ